MICGRGKWSVCLPLLTKWFYVSELLGTHINTLIEHVHWGLFHHLFIVWYLRICPSNTQESLFFFLQMKSVSWNLGKYFALQQIIAINSGFSISAVTFPVAKCNNGYKSVNLSWEEMAAEQFYNYLSWTLQMCRLLSTSRAMLRRADVVQTSQLAKLIWKYHLSFTPWGYLKHRDLFCSWTSWVQNYTFSDLAGGSSQGGWN